MEYLGHQWSHQFAQLNLLIQHIGSHQWLVHGRLCVWFHFWHMFYRYVWGLQYALYRIPLSKNCQIMISQRMYIRNLLRNIGIWSFANRGQGNRYYNRSSLIQDTILWQSYTRMISSHQCEADLKVLSHYQLVNPFEFYIIKGINNRLIYR